MRSVATFIKKRPGPFRPYAMYIEGFDLIVVVASDAEYSLAPLGSDNIAGIQRRGGKELIGFELSHAAGICQAFRLIVNGKIPTENVCDFVVSRTATKYSADIRRIQDAVCPYCKFVKDFQLERSSVIVT